MCVTECNQMEHVHELVGQKDAVDLLFLEACVSYKIYEFGKILMFQKFLSTFICTTIIGVYDGEVGGDGGTPSKVQTTKSHDDLQVT